MPAIYYTYSEEVIMEIDKRVDPELVVPLENVLMMTNGGLNLNDIPSAREMLTQLTTAMKEMAPVVEKVIAKDFSVQGPENSPNVSVRVYTPEGAKGKLPGLLWMHGGGYVLGSLDSDDVKAATFSQVFNCVVVSVDYRLSPENPYPAPIEDCYAALKWFAQNAQELGVDNSRIAIGGASAGGGLAAGLALLVRDRAEIVINFQLLIYPMIDDRNIEQASGETSDTLWWTRENNLIGWRSYLGHEPAQNEEPYYAAPSRAQDLTGLPSAYIPVGELDLFLSENIDYAHRLLNSGVAAELHIYPGAYHGFNSFAPEAAVTKRFNEELIHIMETAFK